MSTPSFLEEIFSGGGVGDISVWKGCIQEILWLLPVLPQATLFVSPQVPHPSEPGLNTWFWEADIHPGPWRTVCSLFCIQGQEEETES